MIYLIIQFSIGTIHNRIKEAMEKARKIDQNQDLSSIDVALLDELFQGSRPVLTGVDAHSTKLFSFGGSRTSR